MALQSMFASMPMNFANWCTFSDRHPPQTYSGPGDRCSPHPVVGIKKDALDRVRMSASKHINGTDREIHSLACVAVRLNVPVADQHSPAVPGSIQSRRTANNVSAVLSGTGTRNVFPD
jgi:hypothetical protein